MRIFVVFHDKTWLQSTSAFIWHWIIPKHWRVINLIYSHMTIHKMWVFQGVLIKFTEIKGVSKTKLYVVTRAWKYFPFLLNASTYVCVNLQHYCVWKKQANEIKIYTYSNVEWKNSSFVVNLQYSRLSLGRPWISRTFTKSDWFSIPLGFHPLKFYPG